MGNTSLVQMPQNFMGQVQWILKVYKDANIEFADGFQKDVIQNAVGARKRNTWKYWSVSISIKSNAKGTFIIIEDTGTVGLTGKNLSILAINKKMQSQTRLGPQERLARFCSMNNSGGNVTGGGLFGVGKIMYLAASKDCKFYFDSLREDGLYVANQNFCGQLRKKALENEKAKAFILESTGLEPKLTRGTRMIIVNPVGELMQAIESGTIISMIQDSWWRIMEQFSDDAAIWVNGQKVPFPDFKDNALQHFELTGKEEFSAGYVVKHFGLYKFKEEDSLWRGFSYYRKGMKIGAVDLRDIPLQLTDKLWGYIEVDSEWETALAEIEDSTHFGVSKGQKRKKAYQYLKDYVNLKIHDILLSWGDIEDENVENQDIQTELDAVANEIEKEFLQKGVEKLGTGGKKQHNFIIGWQNVHYPYEVQGKISKKVLAGDTISFCITIKNQYLRNAKFEYELSVKGKQSGDLRHTIKHTTTKALATDEIFTESIALMISEETAERYSENEIIFSVMEKRSKKKRRKKLSFFFECDEVEKEKKNVRLSVAMQLPHKGSRRVNFGDVIQNIQYHIVNHTPYSLNYMLRVTMHDAADGTLLSPIANRFDTIPAYTEADANSIKEVQIDEETYGRTLMQGNLQLKACLVSIDNNELYHAGEEIAHLNYGLLLNMDEHKGSKLRIELKDAPEDKRRSWYRVGAHNNNVICLNIGHTSYQGVQEFKAPRVIYMNGQVVKQAVCISLHTGSFEHLLPNDKSLDDPVSVVEAFLDMVENLNYKVLQTLK